eukprot:TRINITY_DN476_c0_g1_i4.p1 TRINITY_DN476_c0_g1~~TRINITY_DN476_c0_g1_i4.p1  ORF type:complete len:1532 (+),score=276.30 TRINITY_DN476_c0_g1_i4:320-4597(+)
MAVVACSSQEGEHALMDILNGHEDVEMAVPDTWMRSFGDFAQGHPKSSHCVAHSSCKAIGLAGDCCPTADGVRLACCDQSTSKPNEGEDDKLEAWEHGLSTVVFHSFHGHYVRAHPNGRVALQSNESIPHEDTQFFVVPNQDGTVSLKTRHGTYLVAMHSGSVATWHRGHSMADDWEKFHFVYHQDGRVSLRSHATDMYITAEHPEIGNPPGAVLGNKETADDWEKFTVKVHHGQDSKIPNDANFSKLWGMDHFGGRDIDAVEAWKTFTGDSSKGIVVAVIDTGIDYTHPDLKDRMWVNPNEIPNNGIDDDNNGIVDDVYGADFANSDGDPMDDQMHGTHCSGTIAGSGNNGLGVAGVTWQGVRLMALKFLTASGGGRTSDAIKALNYAVAMGARLTSNSWGGGGSSSAMRVAIERADRAGMLFVAAAGNEASNNDDVGSYPANYPSSSIISVASTTLAGKLSSFSNYGETMVDVAAPGSDIFSSVPHGKYASLSGTSMACPHVSGLAALVWLYRPRLSAHQVKEIILQSAVRQHALKGTSATDGIINARRALALASAYEAPVPPLHGPRKLAFQDVDPKVGRIGGTLTITAANNEIDVDYYSVHFLSTAGVLMHSIARVNATGAKEMTVELNRSLVIPLYVKGFAVVAGNASAEADIASAATVDIEDYGEPDCGPRNISWGGDADGRVGFVAGALRVQRADNERSISHYNIYWQKGSKRGALIGKVPGIGFMRPTCQGDCELLNISNSGGIYEVHRGAYGNNEDARISLSGPALVTITSFLTEKSYDTLEIGSRSFSGTTLRVPLTVRLPAGPATIQWSSDRSETEGGWTFQVRQLGDEAELELPSLRPPSWGVEAVAAYHSHEGHGGVAVKISDFDSATMPPSAAFAPRAVRFEDTDVAHHRVAGTVEILPSHRAELKDVVTSYHLVLEDASGNQAGHETWSVAAPANSSATIHVPIESIELPAKAVRLVVRAQSAVGESATSTSTEINDIVRCAPLSANFSGDVEPSEGIILGNLTIQPASDPADIAAYAIYFANDTQKVQLLGRIAAPLGNEAVVFHVHAYYQPGHRLLVVSVYRDGSEMEEGAYADVKDWISAASQERRLNRVQREDKNQPFEPWLRHPRQPAWNEIQTLWTAHPTVRHAGALPLLKAGRVRSASDNLKLLGTITIPGLLSSLAPVADSEDEQVYMPVVAEERIQLRNGLAEALPGVRSQQVKLTHGQALKGDAATAGAVTATGAGRKLSSSIQKAFQQNVASLVVDFEVVPPTVGDIAGQQSFLDRVEAHLILLSQGGAATARLDAILTKRLQRAGTAFPKGGLRSLVSEPRLVAPRRQGVGIPASAMTTGRYLAEDRLELVPEAITDEDEETQEESRASLAAAAAAALGAVGAAGCIVAAALRKHGRWQQESSRGETVALEGVRVSDQ